MAKLIRIDKNGTKYFEGWVSCDRCGGAGGADQWSYTGWTCYKCGGTGKVWDKYKVYTPEYEAKLEARRKAKAEKYEREHATVPKIVDGTLKCTLSRNDDRFDMNFTYRFAFSSNKFKKLEFVSETKGDMNLDEAELEQLYNECVVLQGIAGEVEGIMVSCDIEAGKVVKTQTLDYALIDVERAYSAYSEAGGVYPDYSYLQDMDII